MAHSNTGRKRPDLSERNRKSAKHGMAGTRTYDTWRSMKHRCLNTESKDWPKYGGRGIKVCQRWIDSFQAFLEDMGERPANTTIDRIDNDGDYTKENCRWASNEEQGNNRRTCRFIEYNGQVKTVSEWADEVGLERKTLQYRIRSGWDIEKALTQPPIIKRK